MTGGGRAGGLVLIGAAIALAGGCARKDRADEAPPRVADAAPVPSESSIIAVPVEADQKAIARAVEDAVPRTLWTIDRRSPRCIAPQKVDLFGAKIKVTPPIGCTITGVVTRGPIRLRGEGREIVADVPIHARISARDVGGVLKGETATGSAMAHARITLDITPDWSPRGTVRLHYAWTTPPGIDFLGQRITFADEADARLKPIIPRIEQGLRRELARMDVRGEVEELWRRSFATLELNERNPPVWMRVTPAKILYGGYALNGGRLRLNLGLEALTETFVGDRPAPAAPAPLPPPVAAKAEGSFRFFIPVVADYRQLEPVIQRALAKRSRRPFDLPGIGPVTARFADVTAYGTTGGRIAVGATVTARPISGSVGETRGRLWFSALPVNTPGSPQVDFRNLSVTGDTDGIGGDLLIRLGNSPGVASLIAASLGQNFTRDLDDLLGKVRRAIDEKREGDFVIGARIDDVETGQIRAYGQGLYLPVRATGNARVTYRPGPAR